MKAWAEIARKKYAHIPILPLADLARLPEAEEFDSGIYFLWQGETLVYIGKSRNIPDRLVRLSETNRFHTLRNSRCKPVPHQRHTALVLERGQFASEGLDAKLRDHERAYIAHYLPPYNHPDHNGGT